MRTAHYLDNWTQNSQLHTACLLEYLDIAIVPQQGLKIRAYSCMDAWTYLSLCQSRFMDYWICWSLSLMTINILLPVMHHLLRTRVNISTWRSLSLLVHYWATIKSTRFIGSPGHEPPEPCLALCPCTPGASPEWTNMNPLRSTDWKGHPPDTQKRDCRERGGGGVRERYGNLKSMTRRYMYMQKGADRLRKIILENITNPSAMYQAARPGTCPLTFRGKNGGREREREMMREGMECSRF